MLLYVFMFQHFDCLRIKTVNIVVADCIFVKQLLNIQIFKRSYVNEVRIFGGDKSITDGAYLGFVDSLSCIVNGGMRQLVPFFSCSRVSRPNSLFVDS